MDCYRLRQTFLVTILEEPFPMSLHHSQLNQQSDPN